MTREPSEPIAARVPPGHPFFAIIEEAYRVFAYPRPRNIGVCEGCCMDAGIEARFFDPPVRQLPLNYVQDWYFAACDPGGIDKETWATCSRASSKSWLPMKTIGAIRLRRCSTKLAT